MLDIALAEQTKLLACKKLWGCSALKIICHWLVVRDKSSGVTLVKNPLILTFENFNEIHFIPVVYFEKSSMFDIGDLIMTGAAGIPKLTMLT